MKITQKDLLLLREEVIIFCKSVYDITPYNVLIDLSGDFEVTYDRCHYGGCESESYFFTLEELSEGSEKMIAKIKAKEIEEKRIRGIKIEEGKVRELEKSKKIREKLYNKLKKEFE